jgi:hypothetical protein
LSGWWVSLWLGIVNVDFKMTREKKRGSTQSTSAEFIVEGLMAECVKSPTCINLTPI